MRDLATRALPHIDIERGLRTGLPSSYENSRESLAAISKGLAELELKEDGISLPNDNDPCWEEVKDATTNPPEVHEAEVELSKDSQQICLLGLVSEDNALDEYFWEHVCGVCLFAERDEGLCIALTHQ